MTTTRDVIPLREAARAESATATPPTCERHRRLDSLVPCEH
ncbi:MAG: hypothetical protein AVDCRST_MAG06-1852 [uncultured Nocardioides sp.]|uniref:Uncharacterized protein n=1 Tax=uncultured Nocardioides sp. TaxID=198441 RepID=A0A6J4NTZ2_9ACTN|nr:MAG: hypothetical protein AVDCRST_MAG06-1852 [uncultured Nocardioides sp.]